ncbi:hypothetical protein [Ligilactobacillus agilis]|uniref:hypothetical protein n=1 Tax=Ligilactobacillus agilis TaxID=1601 RepID=UPI001431AC6E|nr:hypothetical protein [Ligilactobacillus agilis]MDO4456557.1 hypothetical protein [Ligilactobacillus agilis]NJE32631.1 hypothetical protein [Ligilactobacillus agilis]GET10286.1 hypothetical protein SN10121_07760 [Ligilactobacillus agilis]
MVKHHLISQFNLDVRLNLTEILQSLNTWLLASLLFSGLLFIAVISAGRLLSPKPLSPFIFQLSWLATLTTSLLWLGLLGFLAYYR